MADNNPQQKIEVPAQAKKQVKKEPTIFSMPESYRHGAAPKMTEPKPVVVRPQVKPAVLAPKPPLAPIKKPNSVQKKSKGWKVILIVGVILILILGIGGYFLLKSLETPVQPGTISPQTEPKQPTSTPRVQAPAEPSEPVPVPAEPNQPVPPEPDPFPKASIPGQDADSDGLTDIEENQIYKTNPSLPDTDKDGFLDGNEVYHRYNPNGVAPGALSETDLVTLYELVGYSILYPTSWTLQAQQAEPYNAVFVATTGETVSVTLLEKEADLSLKAWYQLQVGESAVTETITKNGYSALVTKDTLTTYVDGLEFVLVVSYNTGIKGTIDYLQTTQMMINSINLK
ncbi:hypothetical protein ACFLZY_01390 [Patescibacteria group bacterium]